MSTTSHGQSATRRISSTTSEAPAEIRPYRVEIPQTDLDDLQARLDRTLWPDELAGTDGSYGMTNARVRALADYWRTEFDWRAFEARLNAYPQFLTEIDGQDIHFLHVRSSRPDATPLIVMHGWPGSIVEFLDLIAPLTEPASADEPAFHLVIPSLPGFGFGGPTHEAGWNHRRTARAFVALMHRLGYDRYAAAGNDGGSMIAPEMSRIDAEHVIGVHVTQLFSFPSGDPAEFASFTPADYAALQKLQWFYENMFSFNTVHSQQPQTLAFAIGDSPVGLLAWNAQLMGETLDAEFVVSNVAIYWLTRTAASAIRFYYEDAHASEKPAEPTTAPIGLAMFAGDFESIRPLAERDHANIVSWHAHDASQPGGGPRNAGGHYAAHEATDLLVRDMRGFFAALT
jgi:pimeloyl-ACP methyl ester carboxylesterase